jgi:hypothetical protein
MYQDEVAQNPEMRAVIAANMALSKAGKGMPIQVVERLNDGLWVALNCSVDLLGDVACMLNKLGCEARSAPRTSLFVPFRDTVRDNFQWFIRINGGPDGK